MSILRLPHHHYSGWPFLFHKIRSWSFTFLFQLDYLLLQMIEHQVMIYFSLHQHYLVLDMVSKHIQWTRYTYWTAHRETWRAKDASSTILDHWKASSCMWKILSLKLTRLHTDGCLRLYVFLSLQRMWEYQNMPYMPNQELFQKSESCCR
jgi:hypothetical protein